MRVSFDLDGVLYPWHREVWRKKFQRTYYQQSYEQFWQSTWKEIAEETWQEIINDPELYKASASAEIVRMVQSVSMSHFIFYISSRPESLKRVSQTWLVRNGFPYAGELNLTDNKVKTCAKLEIDVHVEDRIDTMHELCDNDIRVIGIKQPWNEDKITEFPYVTDILRVERELSRLDTARKVHGRRNGNS